MNRSDQIILSLGSNRKPKENIEKASLILRKVFPGICFSTVIMTDAYGSFLGAEPFLNRVAVAYSPLPVESVIEQLKKIEKRMGRRPEDKELRSMPIDIDLLVWHNIVMKPDDIRNSHIRRLMAELV